MNLLEKNLWIKLLSYLGFLGSWYISFLLASTLANTYIDYAIAFVFVTVMQSASFYFFIKSKEEKKYIIIAIVLFLISILGTVGYQISIHNKASNESYKTSEVYKNYNDNLDMKKDLIEDIKNEKIQTKDMYNKQINSLAAQRKAMPNNYITRKAQITEEINKVNVIMNDELKILNDKISSLTLEVTSASAPTQLELLDTKGYLGIACILSKWLGTTQDTMMLIIQLVIAIAFEVTAVMLHMSVSEPIPIKPRKITNINRSVVQKTTSIAPKLDDISIKKYRDAMEQTSENNYCKGYIKISKLAGLTSSKGRTVFEHLKQEGVIETTKEGTLIKKYQKKSA